MVSFEVEPASGERLREGKDFGAQSELAQLAGTQPRRLLSALAMRLTVLAMGDIEGWQWNWSAPMGPEAGDYPAWRVELWRHAWRSVHG